MKYNPLKKYVYLKICNGISTAQCCITYPIRINCSKIEVLIIEIDKNNKYNFYDQNYFFGTIDNEKVYINNYNIYLSKKVINKKWQEVTDEEYEDIINTYYLYELEKSMKVISDIKEKPQNYYLK